MGENILWFGAGMLTMACVILVLGIFAARKERRIEFYAGILLPQDGQLLVRMLVLNDRAAEDSDANRAILLELGLIERMGDYHVLTRLGGQVARHMRDANRICTL